MYKIWYIILYINIKIIDYKLLNIKKLFILEKGQKLMLRLKKFIMPAFVVLMIASLAGCSECGFVIKNNPELSELSIHQPESGDYLHDGKPELPADMANWSEFDYKLDPIFKELVIKCDNGIMDGSISKENLEEKVGQYQKFFGPFKLTLKGTYDKDSYQGDFNSEFDTKGSDARVGEGKTLGEQETWPIVRGYKGTWSGKFYSTKSFLGEIPGNDSNAAQQAWFVTLTFDGQLIYQGFNNKNEMNSNSKYPFVVTFILGSIE
jgi:hypothetical protein